MSYDPYSEDEELGIDFHVSPLEGDDDSHAADVRVSDSPDFSHPVRARELGDGPITVRAMGSAIAARYPTVKTILLTNADGRQLLLVRDGM